VYGSIGVWVRASPFDVIRNLKYLFHRKLLLMKVDPNQDRDRNDIDALLFDHLSFLEYPLLNFSFLYREKGKVSDDLQESGLLAFVHILFSFYILSLSAIYLGFVDIGLLCLL